MNKRTSAILLGVIALSAVAALARPHKSSTAATPVFPEKTSASAPASASADFGSGSIRGSLSNSKVPAQGGDVFVAFDVNTRETKRVARPPLGVAIVIDRSGSMAGEGKIEHARAAARGLVDRLRPEDRCALVEFDDRADVLVHTVSGDAAGKAVLHNAINMIVPRGGTNIGAGLALGREQLATITGNRVRRVILLSDGRANVGITSVPMLAEAARLSAESGTATTAVGLGLDYNEVLMETIAESGRGQYYYVRAASELEKVFAGELRALEATVATATELQLEPAPGVEVAEVYGYQNHRDGNATVVAMSDLYGGDARKVVARLHLAPHAAGSESIVRATLAMKDAESGAAKHVALALEAEATTDAVAVDKSINNEVQTKAEEVQTAESTREAAKELEAGNKIGALSIITHRREAMKKSKVALPQPSAKAQAAALDEIYGGATGAAPAAEALKGGRYFSRDLEKK
jgi:Ca-activated chloride channel family protein